MQRIDRLPVRPLTQLPRRSHPVVWMVHAWHFDRGRVADEMLVDRFAAEFTPAEIATARAYYAGIRFSFGTAWEFDIATNALLKALDR